MNNNTEEEFFEVGSYFHSPVYSQLRSILSWPASDVNDYIVEMRDVTNFYEEPCVSDILFEGFVTKEDMLDFVYRLKQCINIDRNKKFEDPLIDKKIHLNIEVLVEWTGKSGKYNLEWNINAASEYISERIKHFEKRDKIDLLLNTPLKGQIELLSIRKRCEDRLMQESEFRINTRDLAYDELIKDRNGFNFETDYNNFENLLDNTQKSIEYLNRVYSDMAKSMLPTVQNYSQMKAYYETEIAKLKNQNKTISEELRLKKEDKWSQYMTRENVVEYIASKEDGATRDTLISLIQAILPKSMHKQFKKDIQKAQNDANPQNNPVTVNQFFDQSRLIDNSKSINVKTDDEDKLLPK